MKTIEEISSYIRNNNLITILPSKENKIDKMIVKSAKHINLLLNQLVDGEKIEFAMLADAIYKGENWDSISMSGLGALIITSNRRLLYGRIDIWFGINILECVDLTDIIDITFSLKTYVGGVTTAPIRYGYIKIETRTEKCVIRVRENDTKYFFNIITTALNNIREENKSNHINTAYQPVPIEELKKLKELLDMNIISQEEFEAKKRQMLHIE